MKTFKKKLDEYASLPQTQGWGEAATCLTAVLGVDVAVALFLVPARLHVLHNLLPHLFALPALEQLLRWEPPTSVVL